MPVQPGLRAAWLVPLLLMSGCSWWSGNESSPARLGERLQMRLAPELVSGGAVLEQLPDGARVTIPEQSLFDTGRAELGDRGRYVLASVIEGLLAPRILRIDFAEAAYGPYGLQGARARAVAQFFEHYGLGATLQPGMPQPVPPQGLAITISIVAG